MLDLVPLEPVEYLVIGHLTCDRTPGGLQLGGSATYAALTARALGLRVGIVTSWGGEIPLEALDGIPVIAAPAEKSTTFENIPSGEGRIQYLHHQATRLTFEQVPAVWRRAPIVHIAPVAQEVDGVLPGFFHPSLTGLTLQGWLRRRDDAHRVHPCQWDGAEEALRGVGAAVVSAEDVGYDEEQIERFMLAAQLLAVTEGSAGVRLYWNHDLRRFRAPQVEEVDATGAGDIFAAAFFVRLYTTRDPWEAARFATQLASASVTRPGLAGVPSQAEVQACLVEVLR
jgi:hypothetical protein